MKTACECGEALGDSSRFCDQCGRPNPAPVIPLRSQTFGDNRGGLQAGGNIRVDGPVTFGKDPNDPYDYRTEIGRESLGIPGLTRNWITITASVCTIASFCLTFFRVPLPTPLGLVVNLIGVVSLGLLVFVLYLRFGLPQGRPLIVSDGISFERANDGEVHRTRLVAGCPWCAANGHGGQMYLQRRKVDQTSKTFWACRNNQTQHVLDYDHTTIPAF